MILKFYSISFFHICLFFLRIFRFSQNIDLRIAFFFYLIDYTAYSTILLYNIRLLEEQDLSIEQRLQIFRLKKLIDEIQLSKGREYTSKDTSYSQQHSTVDDFPPQITVLKLNTILNSELERAASLYCLLWQNLIDESPKIQKVYRQLNDCWMAFDAVEKIWKVNRALDAFNLIGKRNYALFLKQVLSREQEGGKMLESYYTKLKSTIKRKNDITNFTLDHNLSEISQPMMIIKLNHVSLIKFLIFLIVFCQNFRFFIAFCLFLNFFCFRVESFK